MEHVHPVLIAKGRLREETAARDQYHQTAVIQTLHFVRENADWIRPVAAERRRQQAERELLLEHPDIEPLLDAFPGAEIADVRSTEGASA